MSGPTETTSQIESELLAEVDQELERRGTTRVRKTPDESGDRLAGLVATAILACLAVLAGTGVAMSMVYTPTVEDANASTAWFQAGALGAVVRGAHYHGANLLVLLAAAYLAYMVWRGLLRRPNHWRWWRGAMLLALALAFGLTGMLLPFDQLALHATNIRLGYLADMPVIGEQLRGLAQGGETIGNATLARFFSMHAIVLPALTLILLRWFWKDSAGEDGFGVQAGVACAVPAILFAVAFLLPAPLGLQGNMSEPHPEARPEWYALPLYELLKLMPSGPLTVVTLFVPPLVALLVAAGLPFIERAADEPARLLKPLRIAMLVGIVGALVLGVLPLAEDMADDTGYFKQHSIEDTMTAMGKRNDRMRNSAEPLPDDAHVLARDMQLLHERLVGNYPEDIDANQQAEWDEWANEGAGLARELLTAADAETQSKTREKLREVCANCHDAHEEEVELNPSPRFSGPVDKQESGNGSEQAEVPPRLSSFFDRQKLEQLEPMKFPEDDRTSTSRMMDQLKYRLRDILLHTGVREGEPRWEDPEQSIVDLLELADIVEGLWERNEAEYYEMQDDWNEWVELMRTRVNEVSQAQDAESVVSRLADVGQVCEDCHDAAFEPLEPIEWRFNRMLED